MNEIAEAFTEIKRGVQAALETYSNVHRGSGHNSLVSTHLFEQARDIVLEAGGLALAKLRHDCRGHAGRTQPDRGKRPAPGTSAFRANPPRRTHRWPAPGHSALACCHQSIAAPSAIRLAILMALSISCCYLLFLWKRQVQTPGFFEETGCLAPFVFPETRCLRRHRVSSSHFPWRLRAASASIGRRRALPQERSSGCAGPRARHYTQPATEVQLHRSTRF